jgi:hypothetical protein
MPKSIPRQGHVAIAAPGRETNNAQLFAQSAHAPGQTDERSRLLHCQTDLTAPTLAMMPVFHEVSRAERPFQQTTKGDRLSHPHQEDGGSLAGKESSDEISTMSRT